MRYQITEEAGGKYGVLDTLTGQAIGRGMSLGFAKVFCDSMNASFQDK